MSCVVSNVSPVATDGVSKLLPRCPRPSALMYSLKMSEWVREVQQMGRGRGGGALRISFATPAAGIEAGVLLGSMTPEVLMLPSMILD